MPRSWSLRRRVLLASSLVVVVALAVGVLGFTLALGRILTNSATDAAKAQANQIASVVTAGEYTAAAAVHDLPTQGSLVQIIDATGVVLAASDSSASAPLTTQRPAPGQVIASRSTRVGDEVDQYVVVVQGVIDASGLTYTLVVATPQNTESRTVQVATALLAAAACALAVVLLLLIHRILNSALEPVARIRRQVAAISTAGSQERISVPPTADEIADLATTMNEMLDRLARADATTRRFISDASHELRSPLTTIRTTLETSEHTPEPENALLQSETLRLQYLVDDLLTLAKADDHGLILRHDEVDVDDLVAAEAKRLRAISTGSVQSVVTAARVRGDADRIAQILRNLTDNALRHTTGGIRLSVVPGAGRVVVHVDNQGEPIPDKDREAIFERFTRLDNSRTRDGGGSGLGLAIARTLAEAHGGSITAGQAPDSWCRFTLTLPLEPEHSMSVQKPFSDRGAR